MRMNPIEEMKRESIFLKVLGSGMLILAIGMLPSLIYDIVDGNDLKVFLYPMLVILIVGTLFTIFTRYPSIINPIDGLLVIALMWFMMVVIGSIPFMLSGINFVDSIFESTSGITTTGATILADIESWPRGMLMWRSMLQWIGGIMIILLFMFFLPMIGFGSRSLFDNETSGSGSGNLSLRLKDAGTQFVKIYMVLSIVLVLLLVVLGTPLYDSLCITFSTISTGGFAPKGDSIASYSPIVKLVVALFMFLGGTNFYLHYKATYHKKPSVYLHNQEFLIMVGIIVAASVFTIAVLSQTMGFNIDTVVDSIFTIVSASTTTGFASIDYSLWISSLIAIMFLAIVIGGSAGSTAGGLKISRVVILVKNAYNGLKSSLHPNAVYNVKMDKNIVDKTTVTNTVNLTILFAMTLAIGTAVFMLLGSNFEISFTTALSSITTFGPSMDHFGPYGSYNNMHTFGKLFMCFLMIVGRLEFITALIVFTPGFWREFMLSRRSLLKKPFRGLRR